MQMTRRFLSMILTVAMICGMLTGITISASAVSVSGSFVKYTAEADGTSRQATPITPCITPRPNPMRRAPA